jgi:hypothetical protein
VSNGHDACEGSSSPRSVSADGLIGEPHTWTGDHFGEEAGARALEQMHRTDAMVMGRGT